jgi:hypothetical protein
VSLKVVGSQKADENRGVVLAFGQREASTARHQLQGIN